MTNKDNKNHWLKVAFTILLLCAGLQFGCVSEKIATDLEPPPIVQITPRSDDTALVEQGIDAVPEGHWIFLSWLASPAEDLAGYRIYRKAEDSLNVELIVELAENITQYEDHDPVLAPNQTTGLSQSFSYWVTAFDESGNESALSEEATYKLLIKPMLFPPANQGGNVKLSWSNVDPGGSFSYYILRLFEWNSGQWVPFWAWKYQLPSPLEFLYTGQLNNGGTYRFQVDISGTTPLEGSEAALTFTYPVL